MIFPSITRCLHSSKKLHVPVVVTDLRVNSTVIIIGIITISLNSKDIYIYPRLTYNLYSNLIIPQNINSRCVNCIQSEDIAGVREITAIINEYICEKKPGEDDVIHDYWSCIVCWRMSPEQQRRAQEVETSSQARAAWI
ncbi:hypothetical protein BCON_0031g00460 [Botryotinia convoluta]|uniref:Uncharacterized protein n=1 Tax=Botryotinia convoluta TaxID=54673 RepID=A0A4Z1IHY0_9HELO|nr:hypothetical protein BCON_0031g00460 [Botryotinia convoluta]